MALSIPAVSSANTALADFYRTVAAPWLLEFLRGRQLFTRRAGGNGWQPVPGPGRPEELKGELGALALQGLHELRVGNSPLGFSSKPDWLALALLPGGGRNWKLFAAAEATQALLDELGFEFMWKVSGKGGLHVLVPIQARQGFGAVLDFAQLLAELIAARVPEAAVTHAVKPTSRVRIDVSANRRGQLLVAPFSARAGSPWKISLPLPWSKLQETLLQTGAAPEFDLTVAKNNAAESGRLLRRIMARSNDLEAGFITLEQRLQFAR